MTDLKHQIEASLAGFKGKDLKQASMTFLNTLGYRSEKVLDLENTPAAFLAQFDHRDRPLRKDKALFDQWKSVDFLFQITDEEVRNAGAQATLGFDSGYDSKNYQSYLFLALDLEKYHYTRTDLSTITREVNRLFTMPAMLLMRQNGTLTFSVIDRRSSKRDESRDVLEKVKLIKDIRYEAPHRAHTEILHDLSLPALMEKHECRDFTDLHEAWRKTLDTNELNKRFFRELADWYFWALQYVEFPADIEKDTPTRNATSVIRLLTRLIFCWFIKEKRLIPNDLFNETKLQRVLKSLKPEDHSFYRAILQNLFFGTLNQRMNVGTEKNRKFAQEGSIDNQRDEYGVKNLYRSKDLFAIPEEEALRLFEDIPFLNGGLFDCLDKEDESGKNKVLYVDGFSRNPRKQPKVPNFLFFSDYQTLDLSDAYGDTKRKKEKVRGLINLLDSYKFTVTENTPIEEEIALDPELLGKVFENLLASYNPETGTTARKQTGSFYTPREIVNYMVDESLIAYLKGKLPPGSTETEKQLRQLFAYTDEPHQFAEKEIAALVDAVDAAKILDPACGSGAFPMGILHKLVFILGKLDHSNERWKRMQIDKLDSASMREELEQTFRNNDDDFGRKLCLIENCIYGVDIQPVAIQISKLRFFISLICDQRTNKNKAQNCGVRPLPNLETKFVAANTLIALEKQDGFLKDQRLVKLEKDLESVRHKHFSAQRRRDKLDLQKCDRDLREQIAAVLKDGGMSSDASHKLAAWNPYDQNASASFFDPVRMFGIRYGFDVVIGNPPYIRVDDIAPLQKEKYRDIYRSTTGKYDLYYLFFEKAFFLLHRTGVISYISPNKYCAATSAIALRKLIFTSISHGEIVSTSRLGVFEDAANYPVISLLTLGEPGEYLRVREALATDSLNESSPKSYCLRMTDIALLPGRTIPINVSKEQIALLLRLRTAFPTLGACFSFSEGLRIPSGYESECQDDHLILKQYQFERWTPIRKGTWISARDLKKVIGVKSDRFAKIIHDKIVLAEDALVITATLDNCRTVPQGGVYFGAPTRDDVQIAYVLGLLNARLLSVIYEIMFAGMHMGGGYLRFRTNFIEELPFPEAKVTFQKQIVDLVVSILAAKKADPIADTSALEREIDQLVYQLYGLTPEEIKIVEGEK